MNRAASRSDTETRGPGRTARSVALAGAGLAAVALLVTLYRVDPATSRLYPPCLFHLLTGLWCPGCGGTRALYALLHGDVVAALRLNALATLGAIVAPPLAVAATRSPRLATLLVRPATTLILLTVALAFAVLRNLPLSVAVLLSTP